MSRLLGKNGQIRGHVLGKRCNFTSRTVITPDPNIRPDEIGVPFSIAKNLTKPVTINHLNISYVSKSKINEVERDGRCIWTRRRSDSFNVALQIGDVCHMQLCDGGVVVMNRQPTLGKGGMSAHKVRTLPYSSFRLNPGAVHGYNAGEWAGSCGCECESDMACARL